MIYLLQLLKMLNNDQRKLFIGLFSDLDYELNEMGWKDDPTSLVSDMLFNHFLIEIENEKQLEAITQVIINKDKFKAAISLFK